ncbi:hypothetical protein M747DRAFT_177410 [Aspergillus niger ATCC 13496]|uniref:Uncharacterized protein n=2 Tax=Aspergillus niger TaxID=5061 RepID=A0A370BIY6_ASPNG|nr:hypothetical protein M747DRAFT_177410 [Aspergillus niger ATCC 13496]
MTAELTVCPCELQNHFHMGFLLGSQSTNHRSIGPRVRRAGFLATLREVSSSEVTRVTSQTMYVPSTANNSRCHRKNTTIFFHLKGVFFFATYIIPISQYIQAMDALYSRHSVKQMNGKKRNKNKGK